MMTNKKMRLRVIIIVLALITCFGLFKWYKNSRHWEYPTTYMITKPNYFDYQAGLECSAYSSAYVLRSFGKEADGLSLYENFPGKIPDGATIDGISTFFRQQGYSIEFKQNTTIEELKHDLSLGVPIIAFIKVYEDKPYTHYVPIIGYDEEYVYFAESLPYMANAQEETDVAYNRKTEIEEFKRLWDNVEGYFDNPYFLISK